MLECAHMEKQPIPQIEGFTFRQRLTASARGEIWRAEQRALERDVLVLCFHPETVRNAALLDALFAAIRRLASIKTDLFPDIVDLVRTADEVYVILEDTHAQHLIGLLAGRRLNAEQANVIASKLAEGFSRLREAGLVYANLNPENLYLSDLSEPILPDISLLQFEAGKGPVAMPDSLEASPVYAAPEQYLTPQEVDSRADMFSLGLTLYTLVSGQVPFSGLGPEAVMRAKLEHTVASPCDFSPSLPPAFAAALERLCQRDPAERPQDWDEVLFDFHLAARGEEPYRVRPPEHSVIAPPDPKARRRAGATVWVNASVHRPPTALFRGSGPRQPLSHHPVTVSRTELRRYEARRRARLRRRARIRLLMGILWGIVLLLLIAIAIRVWTR